MIESGRFPGGVYELGVCAVTRADRMSDGKPAHAGSVVWYAQMFASRNVSMSAMLLRNAPAAPQGSQGNGATNAFLAFFLYPVALLLPPPGWTEVLGMSSGPVRLSEIQFEKPSAVK